MVFPGVITATVTPFRSDGEIDVEALTEHVRWMVEGGVSGLLGAGTVGEGGSLSREERRVLCKTLVAATNGSIPVCMAASAERADIAVDYARDAAGAGAQGLMLLPPVLYRADDDELETFFRTVADATDLPIMLYNSPASSRHDLSPMTIARLFAEVESIVAVKECSEDIRRVAAILAQTGGEIEVVVGSDDCALEGFMAGAIGWVSGVSNVAPAESVQLFHLSVGGNLPTARALYRRLLPLARLDTRPKLVQFFKSALDRIGRYGGPVRPPRGPLSVDEILAVDEALFSLWGERLPHGLASASSSA
jgi:4-hydroxy-tetrahydrodipicolinate synthase